MAHSKQEAETQQQGDTSYFDGLEGQGLDTIDQNAVSIAYLSMIQPGSTAVSDTNHEGTWRNSATNDNYGPVVEVVPLAFKTVWTERESDPPFMTVGRHEPNSIAVNIERPKPGKRGFPKMTSKESGNKVEELFVYACIIKDHPEHGVLYFSPTVGSMKACKQWNSLLRSQRLPNGKIAPIFAFSWFLALELVQNPVRPADQITKFTTVTRGSISEKALFFEAIQPAIAAAKNVGLLVAPEASGDAEETE